MNRTFLLCVFLLMVGSNLFAQNYPTKTYKLSLDAQNSGAAPTLSEDADCSGGCYVVILFEVAREFGSSASHCYRRYHRVDEAVCEYGWDESKMLFNPMSQQLEKFVCCRQTREDPPGKDW